MKAADPPTHPRRLLQEPAAGRPPGGWSTLWSNSSSSIRSIGPQSTPPGVLPHNSERTLQKCRAPCGLQCHACTYPSLDSSGVQTGHRWPHQGQNLVEYGAVLHWSTPTKEPPGNQNSCHFLTPGPEVTWVALRGGGRVTLSIYDLDTCTKCMMMIII